MAEQPTSFPSQRVSRSKPCRVSQMSLILILLSTLDSRDGGASTVLTYGIEHLAIKHLIVVGQSVRFVHLIAFAQLIFPACASIGCGGVGAAIANAPSNPTLADVSSAALSRSRRVADSKVFLSGSLDPC